MSAGGFCREKGVTNAKSGKKQRPTGGFTLPIFFPVSQAAECGRFSLRQTFSRSRNVPISWNGTKIQSDFADALLVAITNFTQLSRSF